MPVAAMFSGQRILLALGSLLCLAVFLHLYSQSSATSFSTPTHHSTQSKPDTPSPESAVSSPNGVVHISAGAATLDDSCVGLDGLRDLVIVLKTGASEIYDKLPIHFVTTFACRPDFLIYSDVEQDFGRVKVRDALAMVSEEMKGGHEFAQYRLLLSHVGKGGDAARFKGEQSWKLDKYKFLPMISDAYDRYGAEKKWFVFMEADTYLSMHNLLLWLAELHPRSSIYAGAQILIGGTEFAHGGSGFLLSAPAARTITEAYRSDPRAWDQRMSGECCGDKILGDVLKSADPPVGVLRSFPIIQGETPSSLDWSPIHWCMPAVSWHHADATTVDKLWNFDRNWRARKGVDEPVLFRDYYAAFVHPRLAAANWRMKAWDNLSNDWKYTADDHPSNIDDAHSIPEACERACRDKASCVQWAWRPGSCRGDKVIRLGWALDNRPELGSADDRVVKAGGEGDEDAVSGWLEDRIEEYKKRFVTCGERGATGLRGTRIHDRPEALEPAQLQSRVMAIRSVEIQRARHGVRECYYESQAASPSPTSPQQAMPSTSNDDKWRLARRDCQRLTSRHTCTQRSPAWSSDRCASGYRLKLPRCSCLTMP